MKWKTKTSKYIFKDPPWLTIRSEKVELPSGVHIDPYYVYEYPNWVSIVGITKEGEVLLVEQYRHGLGEVSLELCAGICDDTDENPLASAKRELLEETGYGNGNWEEWTVLSANPGTHTNLVYCFLATELEKVQEPKPEETEDIIVKLCSLKELETILIEDKIKQSLHAAPLWKYLQLKT